jgi:regulator of sirC expression with transglutaminase-like and TPR domain
MTKTLEQAIERLRQMPEERQEMLARLLLHEMEQDDLWSRTTEKYADKLTAFVNDVVEADRRGEADARLD